LTVDQIEREIVIAAPVERVWAMLTEGEHVGVWFGTGEPAKIDLRPGGTMYLDHGPHGVFLNTIEAVYPPRFLSYWWAHPFPGEQAHKENATLVEFTLTEEGGGTRLRVVESGFTRLPVPEDERRASSERNSDGWRAILEEVRAYTERLVE
jgi:uncharacterized protein YndB with AHSA1/START domain